MGLGGGRGVRASVGTCRYAGCTGDVGQGAGDDFGSEDVEGDGVGSDAVVDRGAVNV